MLTKRLSDLTSDDLNHRVSVFIGFGQRESGILTDFYGAMDSETHAVIAVELDNDLTFFLHPHSVIDVA